jgi:Peptidase inhibitor I78 family
MRVVLLLLPLLAACAAPMAPAPPPGPPLPAPAEDTCNATARAALIGQPATALERVYILGQVRIIRPGEAVTMDFSETRINFDLDATDRIARIFCG